MSEQEIKNLLGISNCPFEIEVRQQCEPSRKFNALDTMFFYSDPYYASLCKLVGKDIISVSQLMKELDTIRGKEYNFRLDNEDMILKGIIDFDENWNVIMRECREVK